MVIIPLLYPFQLVILSPLWQAILWLTINKRNIYIMCVYGIRYMVKGSV